MKIFIFEYITGGGLVNEDLPESLVHEGELMRSALLNDLMAIEGIQVSITLDARLSYKPELQDQAELSVVTVYDREQFEQCFSESILDCDAVWPIAPETDGILEKICTRIEKAERILLSSSAMAVKLTGNKFKTCNYLKQIGIPVVNCILHDPVSGPEFYPCVLKPIDGVGCENTYLLESSTDYQQLMQTDRISSQMVLQSFIAGPALSLSAIFHNGSGQMVSCNEQTIQRHKQKFTVNQCMVNCKVDNPGMYQKLVGQIAKAIPGLWGYVGIDIIATKAGPVVLEINPRLTTSYAGLSESLNINMAKRILNLLDGQVDKYLATGKTVTVNMTNNNPHAA